MSEQGSQLKDVVVQDNSYREFKQEFGIYFSNKKDGEQSSLTVNQTNLPDSIESSEVNLLQSKISQRLIDFFA